jgi:hypothetical protein
MESATCFSVALTQHISFVVMIELRSGLVNGMYNSREASSFESFHSNSFHITYIIHIRIKFTNHKSHIAGHTWLIGHSSRVADEGIGAYRGRIGILEDPLLLV